MKSLREELARLRTQNTAARSYVPHVKTEDETRRTIIDVDLKAMGWTFDVDCMREVPVIGMPSTSGKGFADYVLYGRDHKPLAVIEAKKTTVSPEAGREQARIYADCIEQMTGQRPLIFYTVTILISGMISIIRRDRFTLSFRRMICSALSAAARRHGRLRHSRSTLPSQTAPIKKRRFTVSARHSLRIGARHSSSWRRERERHAPSSHWWMSCSRMDG